MAAKTGIAWTDSTVNPILARLPDGTLGYHCVKVSAECALCYAETFNVRHMGSPTKGRGTGLPYQRGSTAMVEMVVYQPALDQFLRWGPVDDGAGGKRPRRVFWCSMTDLFGEFLSSEQIQQCLDVAVLGGERHGTISQLLTKRVPRLVQEVRIWTERHGRPLPECCWPGFSAGNRELFFERWPSARELIADGLVEGPVWCSYEPAIGELIETVDGMVPAREMQLWWEVVSDGLRWVVGGGESGRGARRFELEWMRIPIAFLGPLGVALFYKQGGVSNPCDHSQKGDCADCFPLDLQVRDFPAAA